MSEERDDNIDGSSPILAGDTLNHTEETEDNIDYDFFSNIYSELKTLIPNESVIEVKEEKPSNKKIDGYNGSIIQTYLRGEELHLNGQKPVAIIIAIAVFLQLIAFNVLIYIITLRVHEVALMELLLEFLKYYTGAVIVEMLGLCLIVVRGIFSKNIQKIVEQILKK